MDLPEPDDRLNSWKEIATFLDRTVRTVQRWEKTDGLPLRRGGPGQRGAVVASRREIAEWWERRRAALQDDSDAQLPRPDPGPLVPPVPDPAHRRLISITLALLVAAGLLMGGLTLVRRQTLPDPPPRIGRLLAGSTTEGRSLQSIAVGAAPAGLALSPDGTVAYVSLFDHSAVVVVDLQRKAVVDRIDVVERPHKLALQRDGRSLVVAGTMEVGVVDLARRALRRFSPGDGTIRDLHLSEDDRSVWVTLAQQGLKILDLESGEWDTLHTVGCPMYLAAAPQSRRLYMSYQCGGPGGRDGHDAIGIIDEVRRTAITSRSGPPLVGGRLAVSPDEEHLWVDSGDACATRDYDKTGCPGGSGPVLHALRATTLEPLLTLRLPAQLFHASPVFFPDGSRLAISGGRALRIVDRILGTIRESIEFDAQGGAFALAGRRFVALDLANRRVVVFDAMEARKPLRGMVTHWTGDGTGTDSIGGTNPIDSDTVRFEPGRYGSALAFTGSSTGVSFGRRLNADIVSDSAVAYAAWIKPRATGTTLHLASRTGVHGWRWFLTGDGRLAFCLTAPASGITCDEAPLTTTDRLDRDRWTHVAVVRTGASIRLLLDGQPSAAGTVDARFVPANPSFLEAELRLGAGPGGTAPFVGLIDEVVLLRTTLTPADVAEVMRATTIGVK